jgi:hypothetical protein
MAINQNHLFEDLDGIKCAIVEKNASVVRVDFLRRLLEYNRFTVVVVASPAPKAPASPAVAASPAAPAVDATVPATDAAAPPVPPTPPAAPAAPAPPTQETFTVGVTDTMFNPTNAIFGRLLKTRDGHIVTLAYWQQKENESHDEVPYFDKKI